jgi:hypothetical protein
LGASILTVVVVYLALVHLNVVRSPFAPRLEGDVALARGNDAGIRVLFVGNSLTYANDLPRLVHELAAADADAPPIFAVEYTAPRWTLRKAAGDSRLYALLREVHWDVVVLQEQSELPSFPRERRLRETDPFARSLVEEIDRAGARPLFFMTWAYENGDRRNVADDTFDAMQARVARGYFELAAENSARVAPVGLAWEEALHSRPQLDLWDDDGIHPSRAGSYLAASVFYALLTRRDPGGSAFTDRLSPTEARFLRGVAATVVLNAVPARTSESRARADVALLERSARVSV